MSIDVKDIYSEAREGHRHASDFRLKILGGWAAVYTGFWAVFVWAENSGEKYAWLVLLAAAAMNVVIWLADIRNRPAIKRAIEIIIDIEESKDDPASAVPPERRFFPESKPAISHGSLIDLFGAVSTALWLILSGVFLTKSVWLCQ